VEDTASFLESHILILVSPTGRAMRPRSADSLQTMDCRWWIENRSASSSSPFQLSAFNFPLLSPSSVLRPPTPSSSPSSLQTAHLNLETPHFSCFNGTRKCGIGRDQNFFRKFSVCTNICPTPGGKSGKRKAEILKMKSRRSKSRKPKVGDESALKTGARASCQHLFPSSSPMTNDY
jgi:hypothetical protein